ncbi:SpoIIE family protein phosphatase [bacterium]|nr:SpoIIE family protein phosphatase [bacterium]
MRILIADDDADIRLLLSKTLQRWEHEVITASNGAEAWEILQKDKISFVISDWMMPGIDGLELCRKIRERDEETSGYTYVILLTAKDAKTELIMGMDAGADDFVTKPFDKDILKVRIRAGERILDLKGNLENKNEELSIALNKIEKDLYFAAKIQKGLLPTTPSNLGQIRFESIYVQCSFVSGDIFNFFQLDENHVGFYLLDVAGHGIPSAMQSVTLSRILYPVPEQSSLLKYYVPNPSHYAITPPAKAVERLNEHFQADDDTMLYFTMVYAVVNTKTGYTKISQAGHPSPIHFNKNGVSLIGTGGFPVGMLPNIEFEEHEFYLEKGDRLFLYSDGITECANKNAELFGDNRFLELLNEGKNMPLNQLLSLIEKRLRKWNGKDDFDDDVTLLAIEIT